MNTPTTTNTATGRRNQPRKYSTAFIQTLYSLKGHFAVSEVARACDVPVWLVSQVWRREFRFDDTANVPPASPELLAAIAMKIAEQSATRPRRGRPPKSPLVTAAQREIMAAGQELRLPFVIRGEFTLRNGVKAVDTSNAVREVVENLRSQGARVTAQVDVPASSILI